MKAAFSIQIVNERDIHRKLLDALCQLFSPLPKLFVSKEYYGALVH